jgi:CHAT domain-containing protein
VARVEEARRRLLSLIDAARGRKFNILLPPAYYWLAMNDYSQSDLSRSSKSLKTALRLAEAGRNVVEAHHAREALALHYSDLGELEPALAYESGMLPGRDPYYPSPARSLRDMGTLADLSLRLKFYSTALSFSREALRIAREVQPEGERVNASLRGMVSAAAARGDLAAALEYAEESKRIALARGDGAGNARATAEVFLMLADLKRQSNDCGAALADYDRALELYGRLPELTASSYQIHKGRLFCFRQAGRREEFARELAAVLRLSEKYRAAIREDDSRQAFFAGEQVVFDAAAEDALERGDGRAAFSFAEASRARSLLDFVESDKSIAEIEREFAAVARPLAPAEIQSRLPARAQIVQYAVLPDRLAIWTVSQARFDLVERRITADELERKIDAYQSAVVGRGAEDAVRRAGAELYELLVPPGLDAAKQLCLLPDKSLHRLSFASLVSPSGKYLLEDFAISYAPSASVFVLATENARRRAAASDERLLGVGNPDFDREENPNLADLRDAEEEARAVARAYRDSTALVGGEATKERFLRDFAAVEVIHFAGHFVANRRSPRNSKLLFAGGELRSSELGAYKLHAAKLVVLSACETGFERYDKSEGAIGVARTFLALGSPVVVASQWKVDSGPTKDLMIAFHRNRRERRAATAESLRRAQLEVLGRAETRSPFYWAAFALFGGYADY